MITPITTTAFKIDLIGPCLEFGFPNQINIQRVVTDKVYGNLEVCEPWDVSWRVVKELVTYQITYLSV